MTVPLPEKPAPPFVAPRAPAADHRAAALSAAPRRSGALGIVALVVGVLAGVIAPIVGGVAAFAAATGAAPVGGGTPVSWAMFTPVKEWVLVGEIAFWAGTGLGIWAIAQGIVAIAQRRGVAWAAVGVVAATIGPAVFALAVGVALLVGLP